MILLNMLRFEVFINNMARLEKILSKVLEVKENEIKDDSSPDNI